MLFVVNIAVTAVELVGANIAVTGYGEHCLDREIAVTAIYYAGCCRHTGSGDILVVVNITVVAVIGCGELFCSVTRYFLWCTILYM